MKKIFLLLFFSNLLFCQTIQFEKSYEAAIKKAAKENKIVMAVIVQTRCGWCKKFKENTLTNSDVIKAVNENLVPLMFNKDYDDIPDDIRARMVPTTFFLNDKGEEIHSTIGYKNPKKFIEDINDAIELNKEALIEK